MPQTHNLAITYVEGQTLATWSLDDKPFQDGDEFRAQPGDKVAFQFDGPGDITECVLISGQLQSGCGRSPFVEGNRINLKTHSTLTIGQQQGLWGFTVSFSAQTADGTTSFYYLPDPELQVGSRCDE